MNQAEGTPRFWNEQASTIDAARFAVWSVPPEQYDRTTQECVEQIIAGLAGQPRSILEFGCGIARLLLPIARRFPDTEVVGLDHAERMLDLAYIETALSGLTNVSLAYGDTSTIGHLGYFSAAYTVAVMQHLDRETCERVVERIGAALTAGGRFVYQIVSDRDFEDEGHIPDAVGTGWATRIGLNVVSIEHGIVHPDWTWIVAERS